MTRVAGKSIITDSKDETRPLGRRAGSVRGPRCAGPAATPNQRGAQRRRVADCVLGDFFCTVGSHNFDSRVSNPRTIACFHLNMIPLFHQHIHVLKVVAILSLSAWMFYSL